MSPRSIIFLSLVGVVLVSVGASFLLQRSGEAQEDRTAATAKIALSPGERLRDDWPPEEVFRRAFWRHPGAEDRIVHAVRFESSDSDGVSRWAWLMKIHPSEKLLHDLREPSTFGLLVTSEPKPSLPGDISPPDWFPRAGMDAGVEIFQHPSQNLTLRYKPEGNLLYASDYGKGFAKSVSN